MKKDSKPEKKIKTTLPQKDRFIEYAREIGADESGETFTKAMKKLIPPKQD